MVISKLPERLKELCLQRIQEQDKKEQNDDVCDSFTWALTDEGDNFWDQVHAAEELEDLPEPYNNDSQTDNYEIC